MGFSPSWATNYPYKLVADVLSFLDSVSACKIRRLNQLFPLVRCLLGTSQ